MSKYDEIGTGYDSTRKADPHIFNQLFAMLSPQPNQSFLDVGCGTGNYTDQFYQQGLNIQGLDPSAKMLRKASERNSSIPWIMATSHNTGLADQSFDGIIATLTIHHWPDLSQSFQELNRILKNEGKIVLFTSTPEQMPGYWLNHYFPEMMEDSITQMPSLDKIEASLMGLDLKITSTENYCIQNDLKDNFLYCGKHNPAKYFDPSIRNGISSFSSLSRIDEVNRGLAQLKKDMESGNFASIQQQYRNDMGDYLFISIEKRSPS